MKEIKKVVNYSQICKKKFTNKKNSKIEKLSADEMTLSYATSYKFSC